MTNDRNVKVWRVQCRVRVFPVGDDQRVLISD
jgi:hypothetical protein